jgi:multiple sugar transport system ATP-binding protein
MASVTFDCVEKSFGAHHAVKCISLSIRDGEFVALLGPSGCGKTTCLRMLAGLEEPTGGRILLDGDDVTFRAPRYRDVAMVFQNYALYPHMTVRENLVMGLKYRDVPRNEIPSRIAEAARLLDIDRLLDRKPSELSGGQRQRVALGRAIVRQPKAFLMDEPLSNLDAALRSKMRIELKLLHQQVKTTMVYVTHDQIEAMTMADRIAVLSNGQLMQFDTPDKIFNEPANKFVAQFVGAPMINLLPGVLRSDGAIHLATVEAQIRMPAETARLLLNGVAERPVEVGIRPHALRLARTGDAGAGFPPANVSVIEPIGTQTHVHLTLGGARLVAVVDPGEAPPVHGTVAIQYSHKDVYLFDPVTERTLSHGL